MLIKTQFVKVIVTGGILASLLALAVPATAQPGRGPGGPHGGPHGGPVGGPDGGFGPRGDVLAEFLGLTEEQEAQWQTIQNDRRAAVQSLFDEMRALNDELEAELDSPSAEPASVGGLMLGIRDLRNQIETSHGQLQDSLSGLLTPDQMVRWEAFEAARELARGPRGGFGGPPGDRGPGRGHGH